MPHQFITTVKNPYEYKKNTYRGEIDSVKKISCHIPNIEAHKISRYFLQVALSVRCHSIRKILVRIQNLNFK